MKLYGYWRSSASWRVRAALNFKGLQYETVPVNLLEGAQLEASHRARNPMGQLPVLELDDGTMLVQSLPIMEYLDQLHPEPALLPSDAIGRVRVRAMAEVVNSGIQPLQNLKVLKRLQAAGMDRAAWGRTVIAEGFVALEAAASQTAGRFLYGDSPTMADICLVPQLYNARRFKVDLAPFETLLRVEEACAALQPFKDAHPDNQPDAVKA